MSCEQETFPDKSRKLYKVFSDKMKLYKITDYHGDKLYVAEFEDIEVGSCPIGKENLHIFSSWCDFHKNDICAPIEFGDMVKIPHDDDIEDMPEDIQTVMRMNEEDEDEEARQEERDKWL